jgi:hypothetical protein
MFKFRGNTQSLEISATSKEIMLFHDHGFVLLRLARGFNQSSIDGLYHGVLDEWKGGGIP